MIFLTPTIKNILPNASFENIMNLQGELFRALEGRKTQRVQCNNEIFFIKQHFGIGWKEIFKNILQLRLPVISAKNEWQALQKLKALKIHAPEILGYGISGWNPASTRSFLMTAELPSHRSLEDICKSWPQLPPTFSLKNQLINKIADITRTLHSHGINHRDLYLCHFLLNETNSKTSDPIVYLIDLHRAQIRKRVPTRWRIKDLAGLYFSSKEIGLTQKDILRFIKKYRNNSLRNILTKELHFWLKVKKRGETLYRKCNP